MKRRKHKVVVEITFDEPCTTKEACAGVAKLIEWTSATAAYDVGMTCFRTKSFARVIAAQKRKEIPS